MYRLEDIYDRLNTGNPGAKRSGGFVEPATGPGSTGRTLDEVMAKAPAVDAGAAEASHVLDGKKYWGLKSGEWGTRSGTMPNRGEVVLVPGTSWTPIPQGYHDGTGYVRYDTDLVSANIRAGVEIFSVTGNTAVVDTSSGDAVAGDIAVGKKAWVDGVEITGTGAGGGSAVVPRTGQQTSYGDRDDGQLQKGAVWPVPRFTNNNDGTVTDNLTGLVWLQRANVFGQQSWSQALVYCNNLDSTDYAWLSDGSIPGDWRLPNVRELQSLVDYSEASPALPDGHPFDSVVAAGQYWSSSIWVNNLNSAWQVQMSDGGVNRSMRTYTLYVWPVRDP